MFTTLNEIRKHNPCLDGWKKLLSYLGKTQADNEPLSYVTIFESNGIDNAIWSLRTGSNCQKIVDFAIMCACDVLHIYETTYPKNKGVRKTLEFASVSECIPDAFNASIVAEYHLSFDAYHAANAASFAAYSIFATHHVYHAVRAARDAVRAARNDEHEIIERQKQHFITVFGG